MKSMGNTWLKWFTCARCGNEYPITYRVFQNGLPMCTFLPCADRDVATDTTPGVTPAQPEIPNGRD